jgi:branched-chain amino acid transport system ATP-binding protein
VDEVSLAEEVGDAAKMAIGTTSLKAEIFDAIKRIQANGTAILIAERDAQSALRVADRVVVLEHGRVGRAGSSAELGRDDYIRQADLGVN